MALTYDVADADGHSSSRSRYRRSTWEPPFRERRPRIHRRERQGAPQCRGQRTAFKPRSAPSSGRALLAVARLLITRRQCSPSSPNPGAAWSRSNLGRAAGALRLPRWSARRRPRRSPSLRGTGSSNPSPSSAESAANSSGYWLLTMMGSAAHLVRLAEDQL